MGIKGRILPPKSEQKLVRQTRVSQEFGPRLKAVREKANLTQREVAELCGVSQKGISHIETNSTIYHRVTLVRKLQDLFGESLDELPAPERLPRKEYPVPVTQALRKAGFGGTDKELEELISKAPTAIEILKDPVPLTPLEDESDFSLRRLIRSAQYVSDNLPRLKELYEKTLREMQRIEQRVESGLSREQIAILKDKAKRWDDLQAILERKARV